MLTTAKNGRERLASALQRIHPLELTERAGAATHLLSSLEYLVRSRDRSDGGLNHWPTMRPGFPKSLKFMMPVFDFFSDERRVKALHASRVIASVALLLPGKNNAARVGLNGYLTLSQFVIYPRHFYGTDGSDQVAFLIQSGATLGRLSHRDRGRDHGAAFIGAQVMLSYCASGLAKLPGQRWRTGEALPQIMRTQTYGDEWLYNMLREYPQLSKAMAYSVLALECLFPAVLINKGRYVDVALAFMAVFHLGNARFMGLSRFAVAFIGTYPCVRALARKQV